MSRFSSQWLEHGMASAYLIELCTPVTAAASRRGGLRSVTTSNFIVPRWMQTLNLRHPCVQCRWSSLLECLAGLLKVVRSFVRLFLRPAETFLYCRYWY